MSQDPQIGEGGTPPEQKKPGVRVFWWTLGLLIVLIAVYVTFHIMTFRTSPQLHYETAGVAGGRQELLVTLAVMENQLETPSATAAPAVRALLHDLEQSVLAAETRDDVITLFETAAQELAGLGIQEDVSTRILEAARSRAINLVSASGQEREVAQQLFPAELETAQAWALDALGAPALLEQVEQLREAASELGYGADSEVGKTLADIAQELQAERPNRRLVAEMLTRVVDQIRGQPSLFWSHPALRWLEVMAWSMAGMLLVRLWFAGKYIATDEFDPKWNWWWWAKIVQTPLLAISVVLALSYFELGVVSGETLGFKISLRGQPIELIVAVSFILGLFSDRAYAFLDQLADKILPPRNTDQEQDNAGSAEV